LAPRSPVLAGWIVLSPFPPLARGWIRRGTRNVQHSWLAGGQRCVCQLLILPRRSVAVGRHGI